jgi:hypothetical protein
MMTVLRAPCVSRDQVMCRSCGDNYPLPGYLADYTVVVTSLVVSVVILEETVCQQVGNFPHLAIVGPLRDIYVMAYFGLSRISFAR